MKLDDENKIRKVSKQYFNDYLNFGFTYVDDNDCQIPLLVVYGLMAVRGKAF